MSTACNTPSEAQRIVDAALEAHGMDRLHHAVISFDFRGRHYRATHDGGRFEYERTYRDSTGRVREVLDNDGTYREVDGTRVPLSEDEQETLLGSINAVVYLFLLPYKLNDAAVQKRLLGVDTVAGQPYHEVEVTFRRDGGGRDYEDRYVYWFHVDRHTMDYFAYTFDSNGGGTRFREAVNTRTVEGVRIADYHNFTSDTLGMAIERYDDVLSEGALELVSEVEMDNVAVSPLSDGG